MTSGNAYPNQPDPDTSRERIELETRVLAAALRQSLERGDTLGSSHAHQQIFILLKASQEMGWEEPISLPPELMLEKDVRRSMPDIDWGAPDEGPIISPQAEEEVVGEITADLEVSARGSLDALDAEVEAPLQLVNEEIADVANQSSAELVASPEASAPGVDEVGLQSVEPELSSAELEEQQPSAEGLPAAPNSAAAVLPLATVPTFAMVSIPSFDAAPPTGAAAILDFYLRLDVSSTADFASIHKSFLRKVRPLLRQHVAGGLVGQAKKDLLVILQSLWIAHDILCDPVTRTDYDFRRMGLRSDAVDGDDGKASVASRPQLRIGELLLCAGLLETTELEIAADMHKAMPELMFGAFLVKQGFIEEDDLNCVLLAQQLLKTGGITAAQFQVVMNERATSGKDFGELLVNSRYLTPLQLQEAYRNQMIDTLPRLPVVVSTVSLQDSAADVAKALDESDDDESADGEFSSAELVSQSATDGDVAANGDASVSDEASRATTRPRELINSSPSLNIGNAVPSWKDQLDWDSPEQESPPPAVLEPSANAGPKPSLASLYDTGTSRSDTADLDPSSSSSSSGRGEAPKKKSLTDLMAELEPMRAKPAEQESVPEQSPFASIWADNSTAAAAEVPPEAAPDTVPSAARDAMPEVVADAVVEISMQDDFAPPSFELDEDLSLVAEEFAALDAAADEALQIGEQEHEAEAEAVVERTEPEPVRSSSSLATSPEAQKESGSWQIVSVPASALASLLLDDEPEAEATPEPVPKPEPKPEPVTAEPVKERRQLKTSFANDKPITTKPNPNNDNLPPGGDRRSRRRKTK